MKRERRGKKKWENDIFPHDACSLSPIYLLVQIDVIDYDSNMSRTWCGRTDGCVSNPDEELLDTTHTSLYLMYGVCMRDDHGIIDWSRQRC
jgi:hypothetical protein